MEQPPREGVFDGSICAARVHIVGDVAWQVHATCSVDLTHVDAELHRACFLRAKHDEPCHERVDAEVVEPTAMRLAEHAREVFGID